MSTKTPKNRRLFYIKRLLKPLVYGILGGIKLSMEKKNEANNHFARPSMDGFVRRSPMVPRRIGSPAMAGGQTAPIGGGEIRTLGQASMLASSTDGVAAQPVPKSGGLKRGDIDDSLKAIDVDKKRPNKHDPYVRARKRKIIKRIIIAIIVLLILGGIAFAINAFVQSSKIFKGNIFEALTEQNTPLSKDSYGKTNILIFGTSEDDPGHDGANLTDSIMILSIDQDKKTANMLSIPRDLWVQYDTKCTVGYAGKINATYECALEKNNNDENAASMAFAQKVDEVFGVNIQYYAHVNYGVVRDTVDAVGGVDVNIVGDGSKGIYDTNFDWNCPSGKPYTCKNVYYPTDGTYHLTGTQALYLARARADGGLYSYKDFGLARGDFDRQQNQQKILQALQAKATSASVLANPLAVTNLINSLGSNLRTNFQTKEITTLVSLAKTVKPADVKSLDITASSLGIITTGTGPDGSSIVRPTAGLLDYSDLRSYVKAVWSGDTSALENATVAVYNGSQTAGVAGTTATTLKDAGFNVTTIDDVTKDYAPKYTLYDLSGGKKPATLAKLEKQLGVTVTTGTPSDVSSDADFVVIVGEGTTSSSSSSSSSSGQ